MNAIKVHSGHNHSNSISYRGGHGGCRESLRTATGTGASSDMVYPPDSNDKTGKNLGFNFRHGKLLKLKDFSSITKYPHILRMKLQVPVRNMIAIFVSLHLQRITP